jgi:hypothetical protein
MLSRGRKRVPAFELLTFKGHLGQSRSVIKYYVRIRHTLDTSYNFLVRGKPIVSAQNVNFASQYRLIIFPEIL